MDRKMVAEVARQIFERRQKIEQASKKIRAYMNHHVKDCVDNLTGEVNTTLLAEMTAVDLMHPEWLDDDRHIVWDLAIDIGDHYIASHDGTWRY